MFHVYAKVDVAEVGDLEGYAQAGSMYDALDEVRVRLEPGPYGGLANIFVE